MWTALLEESSKLGERARYIRVDYLNRLFASQVPTRLRRWNALLIHRNQHAKLLPELEELRIVTLQLLDLPFVLDPPFICAVLAR